MRIMAIGRPMVRFKTCGLSVLDIAIEWSKWLVIREVFWFEEPSYRKKGTHTILFTKKVSLRLFRSL